jgi:hypothetical protein
VSEVFAKLVGITEWFVGFVREVSRGIAVGRGYEPVGENGQRVGRASRVHRARCGLRVAHEETRGRRRKK